MHVLTFLAIAGAAAAGQAVQFGGPMALRDACPELPALCTEPVMLRGTGTMLTYLCPAATEALTTVHETVTVTTTVAPSVESSEIPPKDTPHGPELTKTTDVIPPKETPHGPELTKSTEPTTTTTVQSTTTQFKTYTVTRKTGSSSAPVTTSSTASIPVDLPPTAWPSVIATSVSSKASISIHLPPRPWPSVNATSVALTTSIPDDDPPTLLPSSNTTSVSLTTSIPDDDLPTPWPSANATSVALTTSIPDDDPPTLLPSSNTTSVSPTISIPYDDLPTPLPIINATSVWTPPPSTPPPSTRPAWTLIMPNGSTIYTELPEPSAPLSSLIPAESDVTVSVHEPSRKFSDTVEATAVPDAVNTTSTHGYSFPTLLQIREMAKSTKTGGAGQKSVSIAVLLCGLVVAAYRA